MSSRIWNLVAPVYARIRELPGLEAIRKTEHESLARLIREIPDKRKRRILDLGTGAGLVFHLLNNPDSICVGVDRSRGMIGYASRRFPEAAFVQADVTRLPFGRATFDLIVCVGLTEYLKNLKPLISGIEFVLEPGGFSIVTLSPRCLMNYLRVCAGHRLYLRTQADLAPVLGDSSLTIIRSAATKTQTQFLLSKN